MRNPEWITLACLSLVNLWLNWWISLRHKRYHGIYRLIAFECIILLVLLNYSLWFRTPFSWFQIISWILLCLALLVAISGFYYFYRIGKPSDGLEGTTRLIDTGIYRYIRHPMYFSLILGGFGVLMKDPEGLQALLAFLNFLALYLTARVEEKEMIGKFGKAYGDYRQRTKMFLPFLL